MTAKRNLRPGPGRGRGDKGGSVNKRRPDQVRHGSVTHHTGQGRMRDLGD